MKSVKRVRCRLVWATTISRRSDRTARARNDTEKGPLLQKPVLKNAKLALTLNVGFNRVRQTSFSPETHPSRHHPALKPASDPELQGKFARLQRHYLSYCRLVWNVFDVYEPPPKRAAPKRRRGCVQAKMAQAAGGSKCGRGGAERLVRGSARMSRTRRLLRVGWMARRGRE